MTDWDLATARALLAAAQGWSKEAREQARQLGRNKRADAAFIAAAPSLVAWAIREIERLEPAAEAFDEAMTDGLSTAITEMARWDSEAKDEEIAALRAALGAEGDYAATAHDLAVDVVLLKAQLEAAHKALAEVVAASEAYWATENDVDAERLDSAIATCRAATSIADPP